jgi:hypothetical protein
METRRRTEAAKNHEKQPVAAALEAATPTRSSMETNVEKGFADVTGVTERG